MHICCSCVHPSRKLLSTDTLVSVCSNTMQASFAMSTWVVGSHFYHCWSSYLSWQRSRAVTERKHNDQKTKHALSDIDKCLRSLVFVTWVRSRTGRPRKLCHNRWRHTEIAPGIFENYKSQTPCAKKNKTVPCSLTMQTFVYYLLYTLSYRIKTRGWAHTYADAHRHTFSLVPHRATK